MSKIIEFIQLHTKGIIIGLIAIICVASVVIGGTVYLHNKNKVDKPTVATTSTSSSTQKTDEKKDEEVTSEDKDSKKTEATTAAEKDEEKSEAENKKEAKAEDKNKDKKETKKDSSDSEKSSNKSDAKADTSSESKSEASNSSSSSSSTSSSSSNSSSNSSGSRSESSSSSSGKEQKTTETPKTSGTTECQHNWVWKTKTVHHDAVTHVEEHWEPAWDEEIEVEDGVKCIACGAHYASVEDYAHNHTQHNGCTSDYTIKVVHHDAELLWSETITDKEAWDEEVNDYQYCSKCGARK